MIGCFDDRFVFSHRNRGKTNRENTKITMRQLESKLKNAHVGNAQQMRKVWYFARFIICVVFSYIEP